MCIFSLQGKLQAAVDTYLEALEYSPESAELLTTVGLLYLQMGENFKVKAHSPIHPVGITCLWSIPKA